MRKILDRNSHKISRKSNFYNFFTFVNKILSMTDVKLIFVYIVICFARKYEDHKFLSDFYNNNNTNSCLGVSHNLAPITRTICTFAPVHIFHMKLWKIQKTKFKKKCRVLPFLWFWIFCKIAIVVILKVYVFTLIKECL